MKNILIFRSSLTSLTLSLFHSFTLYYHYSFILLLTQISFLHTLSYLALSPYPIISISLGMPHQSKSRTIGCHPHSNIHNYFALPHNVHPKLKIRSSTDQALCSNINSPHQTRTATVNKPTQTSEILFVTLIAAQNQTKTSIKTINFSIRTHHFSNHRR